MMTMIFLALFDTCFAVLILAISANWFKRRETISARLRAMVTPSDVTAIKIAFTVIAFAAMWIAAMVAMCKLFTVPVV